MSLRYYQVAGIVATGVWLALWAFERGTLVPTDLPAEKPSALPPPLPPPLPPFLPTAPPPEAALSPVKPDPLPPVRPEPVKAPLSAATPELATQPPAPALPEPAPQIPLEFRRQVLPEYRPSATAGQEDYPHEPEWIMDEELAMETDDAYEEPPPEAVAPPPIPDPFEAGF